MNDRLTARVTLAAGEPNDGPEPLSPEVVDALRAVVGEHRVHTNPDTLERTSHDASPMTVKWDRLGRHPYTADAVVEVTDVEQVAAVLAVASRHDVPVTARGRGSSVTGQGLPTRGGIRLDLAGIVGEAVLDETDLVVTAPAGMLGSHLEDLVRARGYTLGNSPQSLLRSSVGGWVATLESGQFSSRYGGVEDLVTGFTVVLADGHVAHLAASPRAAMGPDLRRLFIGSEGTLGIVTSVTFKVFPVPQHRRLSTLCFPTVSAGLAFLREQASLGLRPFLLRLYDLDEARHATGEPDYPTPVLFMGNEGPAAVADAEHEALLDIATRHGAVPDDPRYVEAWLDRRFDFSAVENRLAEPGGYAETIEMAHTWRGIEDLYAALKDRLAAADREVLGHFSHVYTQGTSLYMILMGRAESDEQAVDALSQLWDTAMETCLELGAELSHHHGGGLIRSPYARRSLGSAHTVLQRLKAALDPQHVLNPGKLGL